MTVNHTLSVADLQLGYGDRQVITGLDLNFTPGVITSIVGRNGCGKSTLLRALSRLLKPQGGAVLLDDHPLHDRPAKQLARTVGLLSQAPVAPAGILVADLVGRGRHPHLGLMGQWTAHDYEVVARSMECTGVSELAERSVDELSGGQRQRVWVAMALAQETDVLLLDEPTTYLDIANQLEILDLLVDLNQEYGTTIVMVLHHIGLAARYSDQLVALRDGELYASGTPGEVVTEQTMADVFGVACQVQPDPVSGAPLVLPKGRHKINATL